jgi:LPXTG-motif cell wall-anchored protein
MARTLTTLVGLCTLLLLAAGLRPAPALAQSNQTFTLRPGSTATITFEAFCTEFGKFFPPSIVLPNGVAAAPIRNALAYIQQEGLSSDPANALEANYGIWQLAGATRAPKGTTVAADVVAAGATPVTDPQGTSLLDAAQAGQVTVTLSSWAPIGDKVQILSATDHFYGRGTLTVQNTSDQTLELYMPVGTTFPGSEARFQIMGGYLTDVQVQDLTLPTTGGDDSGALALAAVAVAAAAAGVTIRRRAARFGAIRELR